MKLQIGQWGNSLALRIPKNIVDKLGLKPHDAVECRIENGALVLEPVRSTEEYTLEQLLAGVIDKSEEVSWGKPEGEEV